VIFTRRLTALLGSDQAFVSYLAVVVPGIATRQVLPEKASGNPRSTRAAGG